MTGYPAPPPMPAGWYPDPHDPRRGQRYWDGAQWTEHFAPLTPAPYRTADGRLVVGDGVTNTPYAIQAKNPAISLLVSFFVPGVGSMINGDVNRGVVILVGYIVSCILVIVLIGFFGVIGFWVWGMVDAYQGAVAWNRRNGIIS